MKLKVASDCSGLSSISFALKSLGIEFDYLFASDICPHARKTLAANHTINKIYDSIFNKDEYPKLDLYVCGFPCQPFSLLGNRLGTADPRNVINGVFETIEKCQPEFIILENVPGILSIDKGAYIRNIVDTLIDLGYKVAYDVLNTKDYGIPQNRERVFIIGVKSGSISWPYEIPCEPIENFVIKTDTKQELYTCKKHLLPLFKNCVFINVNNIWGNSTSEKNPTYCNTITKNGSVYLPQEGRYALIDELLMLQGIDPKVFKKVVSDTQIKHQIGNSISSNVLRCIIEANPFFSEFL